MYAFSKYISVSLVAASALILFSGCGGGSSKKDNTKDGLFIKAAVYDTNNTDTVSDDTLAIYFNRSIDMNTSAKELKKTFDIKGVGAFSDLVQIDYDDVMFHRLQIRMDANSTKFVPGRTTIALSKVGDLQNIFILNDAYVAITEPRKLLRTGQSISYSPNDDGTYQTGYVRSYTSNGDGTVTDNVTKLIWQESDDGTLRDWNSSVAYCEALTTAGLEWQLPSMDQLIELSDKGIHSPAIDTLFSSTKNSGYWSADEYLASSRDDIWTVNFQDSRTNNPEKISSRYVRCVHIPAIQPRAVYTRDASKEIVLDASTNLMWQDDAQTISADGKKTWNEAIEMCEQLAVGGYSDWRLPNLNELNSITDKTTYGPAMNKEFQNKKSVRFWSSTTEDANNSNAWYSYFWCGCNDVEDKNDKNNVRCVRSAE